MRITKNGHTFLLAGAIAGALIILIAVGVILVQIRRPAASAELSEGKNWYTTDDGQTWFADRVDLVPPFQHNGKTAYRCQVWTCDGGKTKFVSHLERYTTAAKRKLESPAARPGEPRHLEAGDIEVKLPRTGNRGWVHILSRNASAVRTPRCPGGGGVPEPVAPE